MSKLLVYTPDRRLTPLQACAHQFFDELRDPNTRFASHAVPPFLLHSPLCTLYPAPYTLHPPHPLSFWASGPPWHHGTRVFAPVRLRCSNANGRLLWQVAKRQATASV